MLAAVYYAKEIFFRKAQDRLDVHLVESLATKHELEKIEKTSKDEDAILHGRITDQAAEFNKSIQDLPGQIVALLKNTGALRR